MIFLLFEPKIVEFELFTEGIALAKPGSVEAHRRLFRYLQLKDG